MNQEFELVVDGVVRGRLVLMMTPTGLGVQAAGDVEFRPVRQPDPDPSDVLTLRDLQIARRLLNS